LTDSETLREQFRNGSRDAVRASFGQGVLDASENLVGQSFRFCKKAKDGREFSQDSFARLFGW
jgi:hypothetical protein